MRAGRLRCLLIAIGIAAVVAVVMWPRRVRPLPGTLERQIVVGGVPRTYLLHAGGAAKPGRPLVLVLHGFGGSAAAMEHRTRGTLDRLADRDGAVVVYPEALGKPRRWNDGWTVRGAPPDDVAFLGSLVAELGAELGVDRGRVFAAGLSNGASMAYRLACERPDLVAAVAPISGTMPPDLIRACAHGAPVSVIGMHGTDDQIVPFDHGVRDGLDAWTARDACPTPPRVSSLPDIDPGDGTKTRVEAYGPCAGGAEVAFYTIEGGGHAWPGGETIRGLKRHGNTPQDFDAGAAAWDFFQKHARR
jgi:polyhydroxybutyrate depolymerase